MNGLFSKQVQTDGYTSIREMFKDIVLTEQQGAILNLFMNRIEQLLNDITQSVELVNGLQTSKDTIEGELTKLRVKPQVEIDDTKKRLELLENNYNKEKEKLEKQLDTFIGSNEDRQRLQELVNFYKDPTGLEDRINEIKNELLSITFDDVEESKIREHLQKLEDLKLSLIILGISKSRLIH